MHSLYVQKLTINCLQRTFNSGSNFIPDVLFQLGKHARYVGWITRVSRQSSKAQRNQKTWLPKQCHCNIKWYIHGTWFSNSPLIHVMCVLWHHFAKTGHHHSHCWCPILVSPLLLNVVLRLCSLYGYITGQGHLTTVLYDFCASYIQPSSSTHRSENLHILLVHTYNKLRPNLNILMEQHLPQWWWGLLERQQIQTSQLSRLQKQVQSTLLLIQVSLCCQSVKDKHLTWGTNSFQSHINIHKILLLSVHRPHPLFLQLVSIIHTKGMWMYIQWFPSLHVVNQKKGSTLHLIPTYVKSDSMQVVHRN